MDNNEGLRQDTPPSFDINSEYQNNYLQSNYESDVYHELKTMEEDLDRIVKEEILKLDTFASLRPLMADNVVEGMEVKVFNEKKAKITKILGAKMFNVRLNDGTELKVGIDSIETAVDPIIKLKKPQLVELYNLCYNKLLIKNNGRLDIINYFHVFTEYYRVNERYLFSCLEPKNQAVLLEEMKSRNPDMRFSKGINPLFKSGQ